MRLFMKAILLATLLVASSGMLHAQQATQHGIALSWNAVTKDVNGNTITGVSYLLWRATASSGPFTQITASPITATTYLDPAAGLAASTTYYYEVQAQSAGLDSAPSTATAVAVPSSGFPSNPSAPSAPTGTVQ